MKQICVLVSVLIFVTSSHSKPICCVQDQFEAFLYIDNANCFIDAETAYSYINGSIRAAYDWTTKRSYINIRGTEITPLVPTAMPDDVTIINDFAKGIQYSFHGQSCDKSDLDNMTRQCLPENAMKLSSSVLGDNQTKVETYTYTVPSSPYTFTTVVEPIACMPVHMTFLLGEGANGGALNSIQVGDVTKGIKDPSIFTPPQACLREDTKGMPNSRMAQTAKRLSVSLPFFG